MIWTNKEVMNLEIPVVLHEAVAEVAKIAKLQERLVVVNHGWQSEPTDGSTAGWSVGQSIYLSVCLSVYLSICLSNYLSIYLSFYLSVYLAIFLSICLSIYLSVCLSACLSVYRSVYRSVFLSVFLSVDLSVYLQAWKRSHSARHPWDLEVESWKTKPSCQTSFKFGSWQHQKRSISARLPQFVKLTASKTKQFCETSDKNGKLSAELTASCQCVSRFWPLHLSKVPRLPRKSEARSYEVLCLSRKIILENLNRIWCSKMQPLSGNQRLDLPTSLMKMSLVLRLPREIHLCRSPSNAPRLPSFWSCYKTFAFFLNSLLARCRIPCACNAKPNPNFKKWSKTLSLYHFWLANVHNAAHFFEIPTSKSGASAWCFLVFWLRNVLRATAVCTLSRAQLARVVQAWGVLTILISKSVSRHNDVQLLISYVLLDPVEPQWIATFLPFRAPESSFFCFFSFSDSSHLCFSICPYCRKFDF